MLWSGEKTDRADGRMRRRDGRGQAWRCLICVMFGFLMAVLLTAGAFYAADEPELLSPAIIAVKLAVWTLFMGALCFGVLLLADLYESKTGKRDDNTGKRDDNTGKHGGAPAVRAGERISAPVLFLLLYVLNGICWLPVFLAVFPGVYSYDASVQVLQFFGGMPVTTHHPVLHTLFLCGCFKLGELLFYSYQAGLAIHSMIQAAVMGAIFTYCIWRMIRNRRPVLLILVSWLFLVANPYIQILTFTTTKDVLFGGALLLAFIFSLDFAREPLRFMARKGEVFRLFFTFFMCCLLRNQGIYVVLFFSVFVILSSSEQVRGTRKLWLACTVCIAAAYLIFSGPVLSAFGVTKGDSREALSVPMQQMARVYHEEPEVMTEEERDYLLHLIPQEYLDSYVRVNADPVKSGFQTEVLKADPAKFLRVWLSLGRKAPMVYVDSFCMGNWGYWYPFKSQYWIHYIYFDGAFMEAPYNVLNIHRSSRFPRYENVLREISMTPAFDAVPVLGVVLNQAFPFWLVMFAALFLLDRRKKRILLPLALLFGYWGTLLLGPVTSVRYAFPLMICVPVLLEQFFSYIDDKG